MLLSQNVNALMSQFATAPSHSAPSASASVNGRALVAGQAHPCVEDPQQPEVGRGGRNDRAAPTTVEMGPVQRESLESHIKEVAKNLTDDNVHALCDLLERHGVESAQDLRKMISTASTRDHARSIAAGVISYAGSFAPATLVGAGAMMSTGVSAAAAVAGDITAGVMNATMQNVTRMGGLGAKYHPLPPSADLSFSWTGGRGTAQVNDQPFHAFFPAFALSNEATRTLGDPKVLATLRPEAKSMIKGTETLNPMVGAGLRIGPSLMAAAAVGHYSRSALEAAETHKGHRIMDQASPMYGALRDQKWLDAADLSGTEKKIETLNQGSVRATAGYVKDTLMAVRHLPRAFAQVTTSPTPVANLLALTPHAILIGARDLVPPTFRPLLNQAADVVLLGGWEFRKQIENLLSKGGYTNAEGIKRGDKAMDMMEKGVMHAVDTVRGRVAPAPANPPPTASPVASGPEPSTPSGQDNLTYVSEVAAPKSARRRASEESPGGTQQSHLPRSNSV